MKEASEEDEQDEEKDELLMAADSMPINVMPNASELS